MRAKSFISHDDYGVQQSEAYDLWDDIGWTETAVTTYTLNRFSNHDAKIPWLHRE
jgi:hypothetical protein